MAKDFPEKIKEAIPSAKRIADARAKLKSAGVKYIFCCWIDLLGVPKTKPVPLAEFENLCRGKGPQFAVHSVSMVPDAGPADPDQIPIPDLDTLDICPWDSRFGWFVADLYHGDGKPYRLCPRTALRRQFKLVVGSSLKDHGFQGLHPLSLSCGHPFVDILRGKPEHLMTQLSGEWELPCMSIEPVGGSTQDLAGLFCGEKAITSLSTKNFFQLLVEDCPQPWL